MDKTVALQKCMKLCSTKEYAPQEINEKLSSWGCNNYDIEEILQKLFDEKFLDVNRYARNYIHDKIKFNKWGKTKIELMLKQKMIPPSAIKEAFEQFDTDQYSQILLLELRKKLKTIKETDTYIIRGKLFQFAASRGFENDLIHKTIDVLLKQ